MPTHIKDSQKRGFRAPRLVQFAKGVEVTVTYDIDTDLDVERGWIVDIVLHNQYS